MLYISQGKLTQNIKAALENSPVLMIGNHKDFIRNGGMVSVFYDDKKDRIGVHINLDFVKRKGLKVSSALLNIASIENP